MATLLLTAAGTAVAGPLGGALGALVGRQIDGALLGSREREGPRLKDLALTTSTYGAPIARQYGRMRVAGTIVWSTDLVESSDSSGGGKNQPEVTSYSYSVSFAVLLSSRPIARLGRIWADGTLLRGAAGDLKSGGTLRIYDGRADQRPDPLLASAEGALCPAYRGCAYAVFEGLQLADFGNRIPALTFEVVADEGEVNFADLLETVATATASSLQLDRLDGFSLEGGPLAQTLAAIDAVYPFACNCAGERLVFTSAEPGSSGDILLPPPASAWEEGDFGGAEGRNRQRNAGEDQRPDSLRYYDVARDYQPGVQRPEGRAQQGRTLSIEFPGALSADAARGLANAAALRAGSMRETMAWRMAELDPAIGPGQTVRAPGLPGRWRVTGWEWRERGVELELVRLSAVSAEVSAGDSGRALQPPDRLAAPTWLRVFELPWDGAGSADRRQVYAAASAGDGAWSGAALFVERGGELAPAGHSGRQRCVAGRTLTALAPSRALLFEHAASLDVELLAKEMSFSPANPAGLAGGANRLLVGGEILQFADAEQFGERSWRLRGLLRGRGGTEARALAGSAAGASVVLLDHRLTPLDPALVPSTPETALAAIGHGDEEPVAAPLENPGASLRPLAPVHPTTSRRDGAIELGWTRRARGAWEWRDGVDVPLVEQVELYRVGYGPAETPVRIWETGGASLALSKAALLALTAEHPGEPLWVRQVGSFAQSAPLLLADAASLSAQLQQD